MCAHWHSLICFHSHSQLLYFIITYHSRQNIYTPYSHSLMIQSDVCGCLSYCNNFCVTWRSQIVFCFELDEDILANLKYLCKTKLTLWIVVRVTIFVIDKILVTFCVVQKVHNQRRNTAGWVTSWVTVIYILIVLPMLLRCANQL